MGYTWNTHEVDPEKIGLVIGSVIQLTIQCAPTEFADKSAQTCTHVHVGVLTGFHEEIRVETIGEGHSERNAQVIFEFEGKQVGVDGPATIELRELLAPREF